MPMPQQSMAEDGIFHIVCGGAASGIVTIPKGEHHHEDNPDCQKHVHYPRH